MVIPHQIEIRIVGTTGWDAGRLETGGVACIQSSSGLERDTPNGRRLANRPQEHTFTLWPMAHSSYCVASSASKELAD
jgi:hypothetical protein